MNSISANILIIVVGIGLLILSILSYPGCQHRQSQTEELPNRVLLTTKYAPNRDFVCTRSYLVTERITYICEELPLR